MTRTIQVNGNIPVEWDERVTSCLKCGRAIGFGITANRRRMPFDIDTGKAHWATCSEPESFRKKCDATTTERKG